jgi:hypothetical protein
MDEHRARKPAPPPGGWVAWERRFSTIFFFKVPRPWLAEQSLLILRASFGESGDGDEDIRLYRRVPDDLVSGDAGTVPEHYWPDVVGSGQSAATASVSDD